MDYTIYSHGIGYSVEKFYKLKFCSFLKKKELNLCLLFVVSRLKKELSVVTISIVRVSWGSASVTVNTYTAAPEAVDSGTVTVTEVPKENCGVLP